MLIENEKKFLLIRSLDEWHIHFCTHTFNVILIIYESSGDIRPLWDWTFNATFYKHCSEDKIVFK